MDTKQMIKKQLSSRFNWFIFVIMIIKLVMMGLFSSDYQNMLFMPFVQDFLENGGNVYQRFYDMGVTNIFPYPFVMLLIQSIGYLPIKLFGIENIFWINFCFKLPSFIIDFIGLEILTRIFAEKRRYIAVFYYASPIILYSVYMHGQLDLIPMILLIVALYFLSSKKKISSRYIFGVIFTVLALLCKLHILAALPIIFLYIHKRDDFKKAVVYILGVMTGLFIGIAPVWSDGFINLVLKNAEQSVLTRVYFSFDTVSLYIPIFAVLIIYLVSYKTSYMNKELFYNLCGIVFAVFLAFCPPMPGWYVWIVPFVALFFVSINEEKYKNIAIYTILNICYLIYFVVFHKRQYVDLYLLDIDMSWLKIDNELLSNGAFTVLSGLLIYMLFSMYQLGVASNNFYKRRNIPFTIGIAGDSGAGKSTLLELIEKALGKSNLLYIEGDGDHKWERGDDLWDEYTALNPKANYLYRQAKDLADLRTGSSVRRVDYDHNTGKFTSAKRVRSKKYVLLCGLHALYLPQTRKHLDLKIYMDSDETLRKYWKLQRDTSSRGHSKEAVLKSIEERIPDAEKYIYPQKNFADLIVRYYDKDLKDCMVDDWDVNISMRLTMSASLDVEILIEELKKYDINMEYNYSEDLQNQIISVETIGIERMYIPIDEIAEKIIPQLDELTSELLGNKINAKDAIIILVLLLMISDKMQGGL